MSKKTEKVELRISPEAKERLLALSRTRDETVSQLVRSLIDDALDGRRDAIAPTGDPMFMRASLQRLKTFAASGAAVAVLALGWTLTAQTEVAAQTEARVMFAEFDLNNDGAVTEEEFAAHMAREQRLEEAAAAPEAADLACAADWERLEAEEEEAAEAGAETQEEEEASGWAGVLAEFDQDDNKRIDFQELRRPFLAEREEEFAALDADGDGSITRAELAAKLHAEAKEGLADAEAMADRLSAPCLEAIRAEASTRDADQLDAEARAAFAEIDQDLDGAVSREEFVAH